MPGFTSIERYRPSSSPDLDAFITAMWLMYCHAPGHKSAPGEVVDLGEVGSVVEKNWTRSTPYSLARKEIGTKE